MLFVCSVLGSRFGLLLLVLDELLVGLVGLPVDLVLQLLQLLLSSALLNARCLLYGLMLTLFNVLEDGGRRCIEVDDGLLLRVATCDSSMSCLIDRGVARNAIVPPSHLSDRRSNIRRLILCASSVWGPSEENGIFKR